MRRIQLDSWEIEKTIKGINDVSNQIRGVIKHPERIVGFKDNKIQLLLENIREVLLYWTGNTYIGSPKAEKLKKVFNDFFCELYNFIWFVIKDTHFTEDFQIALHDKALFQGTVYRYLGYSSDEYQKHKDNIQLVEPVYDNVYVSWNKESGNNYLSGKLYGPITQIECNISGDYYGIDLAFFGVCRGEEQEVVFPTIKDTLTKIEYLRIEDYE